jgi:hypothetical protein
VGLSEGRRAVKLGPEDGFICGYPTNFSKGGTTNYYHVYHVVALMMLALGGEVPVHEARVMLEWSAKWRHYMEELGEKGLKFQDPQKLLEATNKNQISPDHKDYGALLSKARTFLTTSSDGRH